MHLPTKKSLTLEAAREVAAAAEAEASRNNWRMVIAVVDDGANLICLSRMDGALIASVKVAQAKAEAAVKFARPTKALEDVVASGRLVLLKLEGVVPVEGGVPVTVGGQIVGAIGVSGGTAEQDGLAAQAGAAVASRWS